MFESDVQLSPAGQRRRQVILRLAQEEARRRRRRRATRIGLSGAVTLGFIVAVSILLRRQYSERPSLPTREVVLVPL